MSKHTDHSDSLPKPGKQGGLSAFTTRTLVAGVAAARKKHAPHVPPTEPASVDAVGHIVDTLTVPETSEEPIIDTGSEEEVVIEDPVRAHIIATVGNNAAAGIPPPPPPTLRTDKESNEQLREKLIKAAIANGIRKAKPFEDSNGPAGTDDDLRKCIDQKQESIKTVCNFLKIDNRIVSSEKLANIAISVSKSIEKSTDTEVANQIYILLAPHLPQSLTLPVTDAITTLATFIATAIIEGIILALRYKKNLIKETAIEAIHKSSTTFNQADYKKFTDAQKFLKDTYRRELPAFTKADLHEWFTKARHEIEARLGRDGAKLPVEIFFETVSNSPKYINWVTKVASWTTEKDSIEMPPQTAEAVRTTMVGNLLILWNQFSRENKMMKTQNSASNSPTNTTSDVFSVQTNNHHDSGASMQTPVSVSPPPAVKDIPHPVNLANSVTQLEAGTRRKESVIQIDTRASTKRVIPNWVQQAATAVLFTGLGAIGARTSLSSHATPNQHQSITAVATTTESNRTDPISPRVTSHINTTSETGSNSTQHTRIATDNVQAEAIEISTEAIVGLNGLQSSFTLALTKKTSEINRLLAGDPHTRNAGPVLISRLASLLTKGSLPAGIDSLAITSATGTIPRTWARPTGYQYQVNVNISTTKNGSGQDVVTLTANLQRRRNGTAAWETPPTPSNYQVIVTGSLTEFTARYQSAHLPPNRGTGFVVTPPY